MALVWTWPRGAVAATVVAAAIVASACGGGGEARSTVTASASPASAIAGTATAAASKSAAAAPPPGSPLPAAAPGKLGTPSGVAPTIRAADFDPLPGAKAYFGVLGNAAYRIEIPENWNRELVLHLHGVRLTGNEVYVSNPDQALRQAWINEGYAWAASSYSENGYAPGIGADDSMALLQYFTQQFGKPKRVYLQGVSMGGHITALLLEHYPQQFDGALATCGAVGGEEEIDYLVGWAMAAEYASGVRIPIGEGSGLGQALVNQLPAALGSPSRPTARGLEFADLVRNLTGGPRPFFLEGLKENYTNNFGLLVLDPNRQSLAGRAATNEGLKYHLGPSYGVSDDRLNASIRRLAPDPAARNAATHPDAVPTTGRIERPLLTLHDTGDLFVPITNEIGYRKKVDAAGKGDLLVQRAIRAPGHCNFSDQELARAWDDLVAWVKDGTKPAGDDLTGDLSDIGKQFTDPLRPGDPGTR